jgi:hypothetical protein
MANQYGPWATLIEAGDSPQLSAFWRRRLTLLVPASQTSPVLSRRNLLWLGAAGALTGVLPTLRSAAVAAEEKKPADADKRPSAGNAYEKEWQKRVKMFDVPIKKIEGPATFTLDFAPHVGTKFRLISLSAHYTGHRAEYPQPPSMYFFTEGRVTVIAPVEDHRPTMLIRAEKHVIESPRRHVEEPCGECVLAPRPDSIEYWNDYFELGHGAPKKVLAGKVNAAARACSVFAMRPRYIPQEKALAMGMKWLLPEKAHGAELPCQIVGFVEVAGKQTVEIVAEKHLNNQEYQRWATWELRQEKEGDIAPKGYDYDAKTKLRVKGIIEDEMTLAIRHVYYIDRKTGITVRRENRWAVSYPKAPRKDATVTLISQVLEG